MQIRNGYNPLLPLGYTAGHCRLDMALDTRTHAHPRPRAFSWPRGGAMGGFQLTSKRYRGLHFYVKISGWPV
jgi:hypothetical protein